MNSYYKLFFIAFLVPFFSAAQSNYKPGYVVTLRGDTVRGFIDYRTWDNNPDAIAFKKQASDNKPLRYGPDDISFFNIEGLGSYIKYSGAISTDEVNISHLGRERDTSFKTATVFLKVLQKGKNVALYAYADDLKPRYFIAESPGFIPKELVYRIYQGSVGGTHIDGTYITQLNLLAIKYDALNDDMGRTLEKAEYNAPVLMLIAGKINHTTKEELARTYPDHSKFGLYVGAAVNISSTTSAAATGYSAGGGPGYTSYLPAFVLGFNFIPNAVSDKVELRADITVAMAKFDAVYKLTVSPYVAAQTSFNQLNLSFAPQIIYNFYHASNLNIYAGAGLVLTYFNFSNSYFGGQNHTNVAAFPEEPFYFTKSDDAFLLKAGVRVHKKIEIYFNYTTKVSTSESPYFAFYNNNMQIGVNYLFGK